MISVRLIVLFCVSLQRAVSSKRLTGQLISIDYIPVESAKLYDVQTTTEHHCINRCIQDRLCLSALYNRTGSSCSGYSSRSVSTTKLGEGLKAWHVMYGECSELASCLNNGECVVGEDGSICNCVYGFGGTLCEEAVTINLVKYSAVTCVASSEYDDGHKCQNAYDGTDVSPIGSDWASYNEGSGAWIKITFPRPVSIESIEWWPRYNVQDQPQLVEFQLSNFTITDEGPCVLYLPLDATDGFLVVNLISPVTTEYLLITALTKCNTQPGWMGLAEIRLTGRIVLI